MRRDCAQYRERIVDLAEGRIDAEVEAHVAACEDCSRQLKQLQTLMAALAYPLESGPDSLLDQVPMKAPAKKPTLLARLLGNGPALAARSSEEDVQLVVGARDLELRLVYAREEEGVRVMGRLPDDGWTLEDGSTRIDFVAPSDAETGFVVERDDLRVEIPSLDALTADGTDGAY